MYEIIPYGGSYVKRIKTWIESHPRYNRLSILYFMIDDTFSRYYYNKMRRWLFNGEMQYM